MNLQRKRRVVGGEGGAADTGQWGSGPGRGIIEGGVKGVVMYKTSFACSSPLRFFTSCDSHSPVPWNRNSSVSRKYHLSRSRNTPHGQNAVSITCEISNEEKKLFTLRRCQIFFLFITLPEKILWLVRCSFRSSEQQVSCVALRHNQSEHRLCTNTLTPVSSDCHTQEKGFEGSCKVSLVWRRRFSLGDFQQVLMCFFADFSWVTWRD